MAKSTTLRTRQGEKLYPKTTASVTFMDDGVSVEAEIQELKNKSQYYKGYFIDDSALIAQYPNDVSDEESASRTGWYAIIGETDTIWIWDVQGKQWLNSGSTADAPVDSVNGMSGDVTLTGSNINATATVGVSSVTKPISSHLTDIYSDIDDISSNSVTLYSNQTIFGIKTFDTAILLRDGIGEKVDQIRRFDDNFYIVNGEGKALLNIDDSLETISAFDRELAFKDEITQNYATKQYVNTAISNAITSAIEGDY
jgi:hypothetical protein